MASVTLFDVLIVIPMQLYLKYSTTSKGCSINIIDLYSLVRPAPGVHETTIIITHGTVTVLGCSIDISINYFVCN